MDSEKVIQKGKQIQNNAEQLAKELLGGEMQDFTEEEAKQYNAHITNIYKPLGVNILDIVG